MEMKSCEESISVKCIGSRIVESSELICDGGTVLFIETTEYMLGKSVDKNDK